MYGLYHTLNSNLKRSDISRLEKLKILQIVEKMDQEEKEAFYMLIYEHHRITSSSSDDHEWPYNSKQCEGGMEFNMTKLPIQLRRILLKFVEMIENKSEFND